MTEEQTQIATADHAQETPVTANKAETRASSADRFHDKKEQELEDKLETEKKAKDKIKSDLEAKEATLAAELESKNKLQEYLKELETKLVTGGDALIEKERE